MLSKQLQGLATVAPTLSIDAGCERPLNVRATANVKSHAWLLCGPMNKRRIVVVADRPLNGDDRIQAQLRRIHHLQDQVERLRAENERLREIENTLWRIDDDKHDDCGFSSWEDYCVDCDCGAEQLYDAVMASNNALDQLTEHPSTTVPND